MVYRVALLKTYLVRWYLILTDVLNIFQSFHYNIRFSGKKLWFNFLILTTTNIGMLDFHILGVLQVNSISVRAVFRRRNCDVGNIHSAGVVEFEMALRTVYDSDVANGDIIAGIESQGL